MELSVFSSVMKRRKSTLKTELSTSTPWPNFRTWKRYKVKEKLFICICPWINPMTSAKENQGVCCCCCLSVCPFIAFSPQVISVPLTMFENHSESLILKLLEPLARCLFFHSNIFDKLAEAKLNIILGMKILMRHFAHNFQTLCYSPKKTGFSAADLRRTIISKGTAIQHLSLLIYKFSHQWFPKLILLHWHLKLFLTVCNLVKIVVLLDLKRGLELSPRWFLLNVVKWDFLW